MVSDALARDRRIGMIQPQRAVEGAPLFTVGCLGRIGEVEALDDGRFNIVLQGRERFRVVEEQDGGPYRLAFVEPLSEQPSGDHSSLDLLGREVLDAISRLGESSVVVQGEVSPALLVNGLCQELDLPIVEKLDLLSCESVESRARRLLELLDFHRLEKTSGKSQLN
jgi:Lon protease-like protein